MTAFIPDVNLNTIKELRLENHNVTLHQLTNVNSGEKIIRDSDRFIAFDNLLFDTKQLEGGLNILSTNIRSLPRKVDDLRDFVLSFNNVHRKIGIICLQEIWCVTK